jgi:hypothetical protein
VVVKRLLTLLAAAAGVVAALRSRAQRRSDAELWREATRDDLR